MEGLHSWLVCAVAFIAQACSVGLYNSYGTLFVSIIEEHNVSESLAAFVGSISYSLCLLYGGFTSPLCSRFGCRKVAAFGAIIYAAGLLLSSFAQGIVMLCIMFGVVFPLGVSAVYFSSLIVLPQHFESSYALAVGITSSGTGVGGFVFSALIEKCLQMYGLNNTFRILSATGGLLFVGGLVYGKTPEKFACLAKDRKRPKLLDMKIWKNRGFLIWTISVCIIFSVLYIPFVHLVKRAADMGIPMSDASSLLGYISVASTVGKIFFGKLADCTWVNRLYLIQVTLLIVSVNHTLCPLHTTFGSLVAYCIIYGFFDGCFNGFIAIIVGDIVGRHNLHQAIGAMYLLSSLFLMLGPPFAGFLYSVSGSYDSSFFTIGAVLAIACCLMFLIPWFLPKEPTDKLIFNEEDAKLQDEFEAKLPDKKNSWITYDSGIDLTLKDYTSSFSCSIEDDSSSDSKSSSKEVFEGQRKTSFRDRYFRLPKKILVPGNLMNAYAVSNLELNVEELYVVDRVTNV